MDVLGELGLDVDSLGLMREGLERLDRARISRRERVARVERVRRRSIGLSSQEGEVRNIWLVGIVRFG